MYILGGSLYTCIRQFEDGVTSEVEKNVNFQFVNAINSTLSSRFKGVLRYTRWRIVRRKTPQYTIVTYEKSDLCFCEN